MVFVCQKRHMQKKKEKKGAVAWKDVKIILIVSVAVGGLLLLLLQLLLDLVLLLLHLNLILIMLLLLLLAEGTCPSTCFISWDEGAGQQG